jgi:hypothetical protein
MADETTVPSQIPSETSSSVATTPEKDVPAFAIDVQVSSKDFFSYLVAEKNASFIGYTVRYNPLSETSGELIVRTFRNDDGAIKFYVNSANVISLVKPS